MKKVLVIGLSVWILLFGLLFAAPFLFKGSIVEKIKSFAGEQIEGKVEFDSKVTLSLFKDFPNLSIGLNKLSIHGIDGFSTDTLFYAEKMFASANLLSVINGEQIELNRIAVQSPKLYLLINREGQNNWDVTKPDLSTEQDAETSDDEGSDLKISIQKFSIENGSIFYSDTKSDYSARIKGLDYEMEGDFSQTVFDLKNRLSIDAFTVDAAKIELLKKANIEWMGELGIDLERDFYEFHDNSLKVNDLSMSLLGSLEGASRDTQRMDIKANLQEHSFREIFSLIPGIYTEGYEEVKIDGDVVLDFWVKGEYSDALNLFPKFNLSTVVKNAWIQYPGLPKKLDNINFDFTLKNDSGIKEKTSLKVKDLRLDMGQESLNGNLEMQKLLSDNPWLDLVAQFNLNLAEIKNYYPLEKGDEISGKLNGDISAQGTLDELKSQSYERTEASGYFTAKEVKLYSKEYNLPVFIQNIKLGLSPQFASLESLKGSIGNTDFSARGQLQNMVSYIFGNAVLAGNLLVNFNLMDINELYPDLTQVETEEGYSSSEAIEEGVSQSKKFVLPKDIDFSLKTSADEVLYDKMSLKNFKSDIHLYEQKLELSNTRFDLWNGAVEMKGELTGNGEDDPNVDYVLDVSNMSISNTLENFDWLKNYVPYTKGLLGDFSTKINFSSKLDDEFSPDLTTLGLDGLLDIATVDVSEVETLKELKGLLYNESNSKEETVLENILINLKMENGNLLVKPFEFALGDVKLNLGGKTGLDRTIDYEGIVQLPPSLVKEGIAKADGLLGDLNIEGLSLNEKDILNMSLGITGDMTDPKLNFGVQDLKKNLQQQVKNTIQSKIQEEKEKVENEAKEVVKQEVEKQKNKLKEELGKKIGEETSGLVDSIAGDSKLGNKLKSIFGK